MKREREGLACRVEERRGGLGHAATLRFLSPLIEPDRPSYGIRLSDKASDLRPREVMNTRLQAHEPQCVVEELVRIARSPAAANLVFVA